jgi:hypothetical protein
MAALHRRVLRSTGPHAPDFFARARQSMRSSHSVPLTICAFLNAWRHQMVKDASAGLCICHACARHARLVTDHLLLVNRGGRAVSVIRLSARQAPANSRKTNHERTVLAHPPPPFRPAARKLSRLPGRLAVGPRRARLLT